MSRPTFNLGEFLEKERLKTDGSKFTILFRTLRIILSPHMMVYVLYTAVGVVPKVDASNDEKNVYQTKVDDLTFVQSGMIFAMESDLHKWFEKMSAFEIITNLKAVFAPQARVRGFRAFLLLEIGQAQWCERNRARFRTSLQLIGCCNRAP
jgi:hypothetical protein